MDSFGGTSVHHEAFPLNMGVEATFKQVFMLYHAPLRYFCEQLTGADEDCEDIVSQLFLTLWNRKTSFESPEHAQAYLYRAAKNACLNFIRKAKTADEKKEILTETSTELSGDYLDVIIKTEVYAELYRAVESLPSQCSKVITLAYLEGMSNQEIADAMDLSLQTVKNYKIRGIGILKDRLPNELLLLLVGMCFVS